MKFVANKIARFAFAAALVVAAPLAKATPIVGSIGITGTNTFSSTSIQFNNSAPVPTVNIASGDFATLIGSTAFLNGFTFDSTATGVVLFAIPTAVAPTVTFTITSIMSAAYDGGIIPNLTVMGTGVFHDTAAGLTDTAGLFSISTSTIGVTNFQLVSGATAPPAVPEPSSLALLGTGLLGVVGTVRRRMKA